MTTEELIGSCRFKEGFCLIQIRPEPSESAGGILIPDRYRPWQPDGRVVSLSTPERVGRGDKRIDPGFAVGDRVLFMPSKGRRFETDDREVFILMRQADIMAVFDNAT